MSNTNNDKESEEQKDEITPLFRPEILTAQQSQWLGTVLLAPSISHRLFVVFAAVSMAGVLALLFFGDYTRKERINGWLVPEQGLIRVLTAQPGVITQLHVRDGEAIEQGAPLIAISTEIESIALGATHQEVSRRQQSRRDSLISERELNIRLLEEELDGLNNRISALRSQESHLASEIEIQQQRVDLAEATAERLGSLLEQGLVAATNFEEAESNRFEEYLRLRGLERQNTVTQQERSVLEAELRAMPLRSDTRLAELDRSIATLEQEMAITESNRQIVIAAPQSGTVTGLRAELGSSVDNNVPVLSIVPVNSALTAELFVPSSAIGFIRDGQEVLLRYRAFPYQRFGHYQGTISNVSRSTISPNDLGSRLEGVTSLVSGAEAVYLVTVSLERQHVVAYGEPVALQSGMLLEADVVIETRRLIDWVFDPLYTLTGRLRA